MTGMRPRRALLLAVADYGRARTADVGRELGRSLLPDLEHPLDDLQDVAACLHRQGFLINAHRNPTRLEALQAISSFVRGISNGDLTLVYFAGHGAGVEGRNFLAMADSWQAHEGGLCLEDDVLQPVLAAQVTQTVVALLDVCRIDCVDNGGSRRDSDAGCGADHAPLPATMPWRAMSGHLASGGSAAWPPSRMAEMELNPLLRRGNLCIAYPLHSPSSLPKGTAELSNGIFTMAVLRHIETPGLSADEALKRMATTAAVSIGDPSSVFFHGVHHPKVSLEGASRKARMPGVPDDPGLDGESDLSLPRDNSEPVPASRISDTIDRVLETLIAIDASGLDGLARMGATSWRLIRELSNVHLKAAGMTDAQCSAFQAALPAIRRKAAAESGSPGVAQLREIQESTNLCFLQLSLRSLRSSVTAQEVCLNALEGAVRLGGVSAQLEAGKLELIQDVCASMRAHKTSPGVQIAACRALESIIRECLDNQAAAARLALLKDLVDLLRAADSGADTLFHCCLTVFAVLYGSTENQRLAIDLRLLDRLEGLLVSHAGEPRVLEAALRCIRILFRTDRDGDAASNLPGKNLLMALQTTMQQHSDRGLIQEQACAIIRTIAVKGNASEVAILLGILEDVQAAMRRHPDQPALQAEACRCVSNLTANEEQGREEASRLGVAMDVQDAISRHREDMQVVEAGLWALLSALSGQAEAQRRMVAAGLLQLLQDFKQSATCANPVVEHTLRSLARMLGQGDKAWKADAIRLWPINPYAEAMQQEVNEESLRKVKKTCIDIITGSGGEDSRSGGGNRQLEQLLSALQGYRHASAVQALACSALWTLAASDGRVKFQAIRMGFVFEICESMRQHGLHSECHVQACWALSQLTYDYPEAKAKAVKEGLLDILVKAIRAMPASEPVNAAACAALNHVVCSSLSARELAGLAISSSNGGAEAGCPTLDSVMFAMKRHPESQMVCEHSLAVIHYLALANIPRGSRRVSTALGSALFTIKEVMQQHRRWAGVQLQCCRALSSIAQNRRLTTAAAEESSSSPRRQRLLAEDITDLAMLRDVSMALVLHPKEVFLQIAAQELMDRMARAEKGDAPLHAGSRNSAVAVPLQQTALTLTLPPKPPSGNGSEAATQRTSLHSPHPTIPSPASLPCLKTKEQRRSARGSNEPLTAPSSRGAMKSSLDPHKGYCDTSSDREPPSAPQGSAGAFGSDSELSGRESGGSHGASNDAVEAATEIVVLRRTGTAEHYFYADVERSGAVARRIRKKLAEDLTERLRNSKDVRFIVHAMRRHPADTGLQVAGCSALSSATCNDRIAQAAACQRAGALEAIAACMRAHPRHEQLAEQACQAIKFLVHGQAGNQRAAADCCLLRLVVEGVMAVHCDAPRVLEQAFLAVISLAAGDERNRDEAVAAGVLRHAAAALRRHNVFASLLSTVAWAMLHVLPPPDTFPQHEFGDSSTLGGPQGSSSDDLQHLQAAGGAAAERIRAAQQVGLFHAAETAAAVHREDASLASAARLLSALVTTSVVSDLSNGASRRHRQHKQAAGAPTKSRFGGATPSPAKMISTASLATDLSDWGDS